MFRSKNGRLVKMPINSKKRVLNTRMFRLIGVAIGLLMLIQMGSAFIQEAAAEPTAVDFDFVELTNISLPTTLDFGPDNRLYVGTQFGNIFAYNINRVEAVSYTVDNMETIDEIKTIPNYNDDGAPCNETACDNARQVTGIFVTGTGNNPILYVSSSDPRIGAGPSGGDKNVDTNSSVITRLECTGGMNGNNQCTNWSKLDLVRGLPRSEENHAVNGLLIDETTNTMLVAVGGNTNAGGPSNNFAFSTEYAYAAAIVAIDLDAIMALPTKTDGAGVDYKYNLPTVNTVDPDPNNPNDNPGPWGGDDGFNQAMLDNLGFVTLYATGFRNPYDLVLMENGRLYSIDNGANQTWGGYPEYEESYDCTNNWLPDEPGSEEEGPDPATYPGFVQLHDGLNGTVASDNQPDAVTNNKNGLHLVTEGYYAGHPAPIRGNPAGAGLYFFDEGAPSGQQHVYLTDPQDLPLNWPPYPVSDANPIECDFQNSGVDDGTIANFGPSTNGMAEYTASNFGGELQGSLLAAGYADNGPIYRIDLDASGTVATNCPTLPTNCDSQTIAEGFGGDGLAKPLDVIAQGDDEIFPGTVWTVAYKGNFQGVIVAFEPADYDGNPPPPCSGADSNTIDEDGDGYTNADEIDNGNNPCSGASRPDDFDGTLIGGFKVSDLNDPDDDDDGLFDNEDPYVRDDTNGSATSLPLRYDLFNDGIGFFGLNYTGLMVNGTDYLQLIDDETSTNIRQLVAGGTAGIYTDLEVNEGDALGANNGLINGFQFGVNVNNSTQPFTVRTRVVGDFLDGIAGDFKSHGMYIGTGDQDNYVKVAVNSDGIEFVVEEGGTQNVALSSQANLTDHLDELYIDLYINVDPAAKTVEGYYALQSDIANIQPIGDGAVTVSGDLAAVLNGTYQIDSIDSKMAIGFIATSRGAAEPFEATWDFVEVVLQDPSEVTVSPDSVNFGSIEVGDTSNSQNVTVEHTGGLLTGEVMVTDVQIVGDNASEFAHDFAGPVSIRPSETAQIGVTFSPTSEGNSKTATLQIIHNGDNASPQLVTLVGSGVPVSGENQAPTVSPIDDQVSYEGDDIAALGLAVNAVDNDGPGNLTYSATGLPDGIDLEPTNGMFFGTVVTDTAASSPYTVTVSVNDGADTTSVTFLWTIEVKQAPVVEAVPLTIQLEGNDVSTLNFRINAFDPNSSETLTYTATGLPPGVTLGETDGIFRGVLEVNAPDDSPYTVNVTVSDGELEASVSFEWIVLKNCRDTTDGVNCSYLPLATASEDAVANVNR